MLLLQWLLSTITSSGSVPGYTETIVVGDFSIRFYRTTIMNHGENPVETFMKTTVFLIPIIYACVSFAHGATHEIKFCSFFSRRDMLNLCNRCQFFKIFRQNNRYLILGCFGSFVYREFFTRCCYGTFLWFRYTCFYG